MNSQEPKINDFTPYLDAAHDWILAYMITAKKTIADSKHMMSHAKFTIINCELDRVFKNMAQALGFKSWGGHDFFCDVAQERRNFYGDLARFTMLKFGYGGRIDDPDSFILLFVDFSSLTPIDAQACQEELINLLHCRDFVALETKTVNDMSDYDKKELYARLDALAAFQIEPCGCLEAHKPSESAFAFAPTGTLDPILRERREYKIKTSLQWAFSILWDHPVSATADVRRFKWTGDEAGFKQPKLKLYLDKMLDDGLEELCLARADLEDQVKYADERFDYYIGYTEAIEQIINVFPMLGGRPALPCPGSDK